jgi:DNA-binding cell septation regulator SpoVG
MECNIKMNMEQDIINIDRVELVTAGPAGAETGLLGWIQCRVNRSLLLDGLTLRRTQDGRLALSFPARRDRAGNQRFYVRPLDDETRCEIERQVFAALGLAA